MKRILIALCIMFSISASVKAQVKNPNIPTIVDRFYKAVIAIDTPTIKSLTAPNMTFGHTAGKLQNQKIFIDALTSHKSGFSRIDVTNEVVYNYGNTIIDRHIFDADTNGGGKIGHVHLNIIMIFKKMHGHWKIIGRQAFIPEK